MSYKIFKNHLSNCNNQSKLIKKALTIHKDILASGIWSINQFNARNIKYDSVGKIDYYSKKSKKSSINDTIKSVIEWYYFNFRIISNSTTYNYSYIYLSRAGTIKFFDFKNKCVLTFDTNKEIDINKNINGSFSKVFNIINKEPILINGRKYIKEKFISSDPLEAVPYRHLHIIEVLKTYIQYLNLEEGIIKPRLFIVSIEYIYKHSSDPSLKAFIEERIDQLNIIDQQLLYYHAHGDFTPRNIYFHKNEYYVIDIDDFGVYLPGFFDVMHLCTSYTLKSNYNLGLYDEYINLCIKKSFSVPDIPDEITWKFIIWVFYHSPHYANAISVNSHTPQKIDSSWTSFKSKHLEQSSPVNLIAINS